MVLEQIYICMVVADKAIKCIAKMPPTNKQRNKQMQKKLQTLTCRALPKGQSLLDYSMFIVHLLSSGCLLHCDPSRSPLGGQSQYSPFTREVATIGVVIIMGR